MTKTYEAIARLECGAYARISVNDKTKWKTLKTARKHAREYKSRHMMDSWAQESGWTEMDNTQQDKLITYHRPPTSGEIKFGYGATHYRDFERSQCSKDDGTLKKWFTAPDDGLRYYR